MQAIRLCCAQMTPVCFRQLSPRNMQSLHKLSSSMSKICGHWFCVAQITPFWTTMARRSSSSTFCISKHCQVMLPKPLQCQAWLTSLACIFFTRVSPFAHSMLAHHAQAVDRTRPCTPLPCTPYCAVDYAKEVSCHALSAKCSIF